MGRAKLPEDPATQTGADPPFVADLGPATLEYAELYDLFATQFDEVSLAGVLPFSGVVFAELGGEEESPAVSVDTQLAEASAPSVFVVVAGQQSPTGHGGEERAALEPYSIVQVPLSDNGRHERSLTLEAAVAAAQLKADLLGTQLEEAGERLVVAEVRGVEAATQFDRAAGERDAALARVMELEAVLAGSQEAMGALERRLLEVEQRTVEREDRIAVLSAELDAERAAMAVAARPAPPGASPTDITAIVSRAEVAEAALVIAMTDMASREENAATYVDMKLPDVAALLARAERAETTASRSVADLAQVSEVHAAETAGYEERLRDRARFITSLEKELLRREQLVKELVVSLDELREGQRDATFESAAPLSVPEPRQSREQRENGSAVDREEIVKLHKKLDELALEVARREGELVARGWRITELENVIARPRTEIEQRGAGEQSAEELARVRDEIDALRQALTQEHAARVAAESGEELVRARAELARQAVLLEQLRGRPQA
jgi:hypothetical protein